MTSDIAEMRYTIDELLKTIEALRAENAKLKEEIQLITAPPESTGKIFFALQAENTKLRELLNKLPVCPTCYTPMEANEGYWWCPNNDCGQSPEDVSAETKEAK